MKVLVIINNKKYKPNLQPLVEVFKDYIDLEFEVIYKRFSNIPWRNNLIRTEWVQGNLLYDHDIVVLILPYEEWQTDEWNAYAPYGDKHAYGFQFIAMKGEPQVLRHPFYKQKGWNNNDELTGRLRHELSHTFYQMTSTRPDNTHRYELEDGNWFAVLKDVNWSKIKKTVTTDSMLLCPVQNTATKIIGTEWKQNRPRVTQLFGENPQIYKRFGMDGHNGVDFGIPVGTKIFASHDGRVTSVKKDKKGYGWHVKIRSHSYGRETIYAHLSEILVKRGSYIGMGDLVGLSGNTGFSTGPHLHFGLRRLNVTSKPIEKWTVKDYDNGYLGWIDPYEFLITFKGTLTKSNL